MNQSLLQSISHVSVDPNLVAGNVTQDKYGTITSTSVSAKNQ